MSSRFENKICAVTGGAAGFGLGIAERLLSYGAKAVWLLDFNALNLDKASRQLSAAYPGRVFPLKTDIAAEGGIEAALDEIVAVSGRLDVLFNNAGRPMTRPALEITAREFRDLIALNFTGVVTGTLHALKIMTEQGSGYIVNAASAGGLVPMPYQCAYGSTKAAVIEFTRCLAYEYVGTDIHFTQYAPMNVATTIFSAEYAEKLRRQGKTEEEIAAAVKDIKPPKDAMPLGQALDILFAGLEEGRMDVIIGEDAAWAEKAFVNDRPAFDKAVLEIGAKRKVFYDQVAERRARGASIDDLVFPG